MRKKNLLKHINKTFIIAEIGINHEGKYNNCLKLIKIAKKTGADAVKLQVVNPELSYQKKTSSFKQFKKASLTYVELKKIKEYCDKIKIIFFITPGDLESLKIVSKLNLKIIKISSGLLTNIPLIEEASKLSRPIILSCGMALQSEIKQALKAAKRYNKKNLVILLKCTSIYPSELSDLNLNSIPEYVKNFNVQVGYSDHSIGIDACVSAVALGAKVIEKHITLNKKIKGFDNVHSLEEKDFKDLVQKIRNVEKMLGSKKIQPTKLELKSRKKYHRYIVAKRDIKKEKD